jgi:thiamine biosynthesis lipoprotein
MGTRWSAVLPTFMGHDADALTVALAAATGEVDNQMSTWKPRSDLMRLNDAPLQAWVPLPGGLMEVLAAALVLGRLTDGAFDIGVGSAVAAWGFGADADRMPAPGPAPRSIADLLELDEGRLRARKHGPCRLDLSAIAKGYGVDRMAAVLDGFGIGDYLVGIDGELRARGRRGDGAPFAVALERPEAGRRETFGVIELVDAAVATSGDYRHAHERHGRRVSHTIDPRTGEPVAHGLASVTVVAPRAMDADALATALMVAGPDTGKALAKRLDLSTLLVMRAGTDLQVIGTGDFSREPQRGAHDGDGAGVSPCSAP